MLDLSGPTVERRRRQSTYPGRDGPWGEGICDNCGGGVHLSGECLCSAAGAQVRPEYDPERLIVEYDPAEREHSVFYAHQHFQVAAQPGGGFSVHHAASADPAITEPLDGPFAGANLESPHHAAAAIRYAVDVARTDMDLAAAAPDDRGLDIS